MHRHMVCGKMLISSVIISIALIAFIGTALIPRANAVEPAAIDDPYVPADEATMATGIHPDFLLTPEQCGTILIEQQNSDAPASIPDACWGVKLHFDDLAFPAPSEYLTSVDYYHFFTSKGLYYCSIDASGNTTPLIEKPKDAGNYNLCINKFGHLNAHNGVDMYRKLDESYSNPDHPEWKKWMKVSDNDQQHFYALHADGKYRYNINLDDLSGASFGPHKPWILYPQYVLVQLSGTSTVTFAKDQDVTLDPSKYRVDLRPVSPQINIPIVPGGKLTITEPFMAQPAPGQILSSTVNPQQGDMDIKLTPIKQDLNSTKGDPGTIGTMNGGFTANKEYTVDLSTQGIASLNLDRVYARHDGSTTAKNYARIGKTQASVDILASAPLSYDKNAADAEGTINQVTTQAGELVNVTSQTFSRIGYTQTGWNTVANPTSAQPGTSYAANSPITVMSPGVTLYAQWKAHTYTIKFHQNLNGSSDQATQGMTYGRTADSV